jgi:uncharacterized membrane protein (UPF0127 family)
MGTTVRRAVFHTSQGKLSVASVKMAVTVWDRFLGLMGRSAIASGAGMFLAPCASIHTLFMRFDLDLIFISREFRVVRVITSVKPWRFAMGGRSAWAVLELRAGWFPCGRLTPGILMTFERNGAGSAV